MIPTPLRAAAIAAAISAWACAAWAQADAAAQPPPAPALAPPAPTRSADAGRTVSGVTVSPSPTPRKACAARDKDCVALVVAELKRLYPEQLKQFCFQEQTKAVRTQMVGDQLLEALAMSGSNNGPPTPTAFPVSQTLKTACATDKK